MDKEKRRTRSLGLSSALLNQKWVRKRLSKWTSGILSLMIWRCSWVSRIRLTAESGFLLRICSLQEMRGGPLVKRKDLLSSRICIRKSKEKIKGSLSLTEISPLRRRPRWRISETSHMETIFSEVSTYMIKYRPCRFCWCRCPCPRSWKTRRDSRRDRRNKRYQRKRSKSFLNRFLKLCRMKRIMKIKTSRMRKRKHYLMFVSETTKSIWKMVKFLSMFTITISRMVTPKGKYFLESSSKYLTWIRNKLTDLKNICCKLFVSINR